MSERICVVDGCGKLQPRKSQRGMCNGCYSKWRREGLAAALPARSGTTSPALAWTEDSLGRVARMWCDGSTIAAISHEVGYSKAAVQRAIKSHGYTRGCSVAACGSPAWVRGFCRAHFHDKKANDEKARQEAIDQRSAERAKARVARWKPRSDWTEEDDSVLKELHASGMTATEATREMGAVGAAMLRRRAEALGLFFDARRRRPILERVDPVDFGRLANRVIAPGIEKHLVPLLHFRGAADLGRVHRLWNYTLAMMEHEIESTADAVQVSNHPSFSHLCEPPNPVYVLGLNGFWSRILAKPVVADLVPGLRDYVRSIIRHQFHFDEISEVAHHQGHAWWRTYEARKPEPKTKAELRAIEARKLIPRAADLQWPFISHNHARPDAGGMDIVKTINSIVPRGMESDVRADICQDLILAVLEGKYSVEDIKDNPRKYLSAVRETSPWKYQWVSLDQPVHGDEGRTLAEVIH